MEKNVFLYFEKKAKESIIKNYNEKLSISINNLLINKLIWNKKGHIVSLFKDFLIYNEKSEFFIAFYTYDKIKKKLIDLFNYYNESSFIFPNYTPLPESKYIYNNIIKKQRVIDDQENMEELKLIKKHNNNKKQKLNNIIKNFYENSQSQSKFFDSNIYNSILKPCESLTRLLFGIENKKINNKENNNKYDNNDESFLENYNINEDQEQLYLNDNIIGNQYYYDEDITEIKQIIRNIYNYEKNKIKDNKNKKIINSKIKVKLALLSELDGNRIEYSSLTERKYENNLLKDYINNKFLKQNNFESTKNSKIIYNKTKVYVPRKHNETINREIYKNQTKNDFQENYIFNEINPFVIANYNFKNKNNSYKNITDDSFKHKKIKSDFYREMNNQNEINNNYIMRRNTNFNDNYYRTELNTPVQYKTQTLNRKNDNKKNKVYNNIVFDININEPNIYYNNSNKNVFNYYGKIPNFDINEIAKMNSNQNKVKGKEINRNYDNFMKNKNFSKTIKVNDLKNAYMYNNLTERRLMKGKEIKNKNEVNLNTKFAMPNSNKAIIYRQQNDINSIFYVDNHHTVRNTVRINNAINMNKKYEPMKSNKILVKNKTKDLMAKIYIKKKV